MEEYWFDVKGYLRGKGVGECLHLNDNRIPNKVSAYSRIRNNFIEMVERLRRRVGN